MSEEPRGDADDEKLATRLLQMIEANGVRREEWALRAASRRGGASQATDSSNEDDGKASAADHFDADLIAGEDNGFEVWLGSLEDALCLPSLWQRGFRGLLNCAVEDCEREVAAHRGVGRARRRAHARGISAVEDGYRPANGAPALDRDQIRAVAFFDAEWYTSMLGSDIAFLGFSAADEAGYNIDRHFAEAGAFLRACRQEGRKVLVHCVMGINRSCAALASFLCSDLGMKLEDAIDLISKRRGYILSNISFLKQLIAAYR
mmetsp:Transcript_15189/g.44931  ORF Transcript_15189/g.44931 Transcript_15189/m.44931 type:complete len:262 (-) Transcript_15189:54-839(-)